MADLTWLERRTLDEFFGQHSWFASQDELSKLFFSYQLENYELDAHFVAAVLGYSKSDRLHAFWDAWPNTVVAKLMLELLECGISSEQHPSDEWVAGYESCKMVLQSLLTRGRDEEEERAQFQSFVHNQKELVLADWDQANLGIWICMGRFGDEQLANQLLAKYRQGLTVLLILSDNEYNRAFQESHWDKMPCSVWWFPEHLGDGMNHHKFCIVDGQIIWHGPFNVSQLAAKENQEECTRETNLTTVRQFSEEFTRLRRIIDEDQRIRGQMNR